MALIHMYSINMHLYCICVYIYMYNGMHIIYLDNTNIMFIVQNTNVYKNLYTVFSSLERLEKY